MKVECIDDSNRPENIPLSKWVKKGEQYTITLVHKLNQTGAIGVKLAEIDIDDCFPFQYFDLRRFKPLQEQPDLELVNEQILENV